MLQIRDQALPEFRRNSGNFSSGSVRKWCRRMTSTAADDDLITRAKTGDRSAFDQLVGPLVDQGFRLA